MNSSAIIFYLIAALILTAGILAVTAARIFRAAIWLLFSLVGIAALFFWMQVQFIAAVQIVVYVGGIVVLIIFSIFLTHQSGKEMPRTPIARSVFAALAVLLGILLSTRLITLHFAGKVQPRPFNTSMDELGTQLLSTTGYGYLLPFEVVSMLLLAAMVGCIVIAMKAENPSIDLPVNKNS